MVMKGQGRLGILVILTVAWTANVVRRTSLNLSNVKLTLDSEKMEISSSDLNERWADNFLQS